MTLQDITTMYNYMTGYYDSDKPKEEILFYFDSIINKNPENEYAYMFKALWEDIYLGNPIKVLDAAIRRCMSVKLVCYKAMILEARKMKNDALCCYEYAIDIAKNIDETLFLTYKLIQLYIDLEDENKAIELCKNYLYQNPINTEQELIQNAPIIALLLKFNKSIIYTFFTNEDLDLVFCTDKANSNTNTIASDLQTIINHIKQQRLDLAKQTLEKIQKHYPFIAYCNTEILQEDEAAADYGNHELNVAQAYPHHNDMAYQILIKIKPSYKKEALCKWITMGHIYGIIRVEYYKNEKWNEYGRTEIDEAEDLYISIVQIPDFLKMNISNLYLAIQQFAPYLENSHFFIYPCYKGTWIDEYIITDGIIYFYRDYSEAEAEAEEDSTEIFDRLNFYEKKLKDYKYNESFKKFLAALYLSAGENKIAIYRNEIIYRGEEGRNKVYKFFSRCIELDFSKKETIDNILSKKESNYKNKR